MATRWSILLVLVLAVTLLHVTSAQDLMGCGESKGCFQQPGTCTGADCQAYVTWETMPDGQTLFAMRAMTQAWVAFGLRKANAMGRNNMYPADVYACTKNNEIQRSQNVGESGLNSETRQIPANTITRESVKTENNVISCMFTRQPSLENDASFYNISGDNRYKILLAIGDNINTDGTIATRGHQEAWSTAMAMNLSTPGRPQNTNESVLEKAHASLMVIAWVGLASIGITMARFFKPMWPTSTLLGQKVWFTIHRMCMVTCVLCFVPAFILIFVEHGGFIASRERRNLAHAILGIIVTILGLINPIMAIFRPHPGTPRRPTFNWAHWAVGMLAHTCGLATVFLGIGRNGNGLISGIPGYTFFVMIVFVAFHLLIWILFEVQRCMTESQARNNDIPLKGTASDSSHQLTAGDSDPPIGSTAKTTLLTIYILGVVIVVAFLVIVIIIA